MSSDFKKVSIVDDRLNTTDSLNYGVFRGGQNVTNVRMPAISATANALNFVVPFPSESTILDREVYLQTNTKYLLDFGIALPGIAVNAPPTTVNGLSGPNTFKSPLIYGYNISVGSFPTQRTLDTIQLQINNNITTINSSDVFPALLRCADALDWEKENMTASAVDRIAVVDKEVFMGNNSNLSSYDLVQANKFIGNGSFYVDITPVTAFPQNYNDTLTPYSYSAGDGAGTQYFVLEFKSTEPLIVQPLIWNKTVSNKQGVYGIQNLSVVCNYGNLSKAIKLAPNAIQQSVLTFGNPPTQQPALVVGANNINFSVRNGFASYELPNPTITQLIGNCELQMKYITPHGTDVKPARNVCPLLEFPRYITSGLQSIEPAVQSNSANNSFVLTPKSATLNSQTFTFNQVPDKLIIFVRPDSSFRNKSIYNDFALPIKNITIQWNNHAGILANATQEQLFHMSKEAGSNQDWLQFSGHANALRGRNVAIDGLYLASLPISVAGPAPQSSPGGANGILYAGPVPDCLDVATSGSYLMLDMGKHLELTEPFYAPGSLGSFQLQMNLQVENYIEAAVQPEVVIIAVNSGILVTEKGQTSAYTGILTKSDVLDSALQEPYSHMDIKRIVGHGHGDSSKALPKRCLPQHKNKTHVMPDGSRMSNRLM